MLQPVPSPGGEGKGEGGLSICPNVTKNTEAFFPKILAAPCPLHFAIPNDRTLCTFPALPLARKNQPMHPKV